MRTATCSCRQLSIAISGEPQLVFMCHCLDCQKATSGPFGVSTYWPKVAVVEIRGESHVYSRLGGPGRKIDQHFCPACGGRVFWYAEFAPDLIGVGYGSFDAADLPPPTSEYWAKRKHPWANLAAHIESHEGND